MTVRCRRLQSSRACRGTSGNEREGEAPGARGDTGDEVDELVDGCCGDGVEGDADDGQGHGRPGGERDVVVADDGEILGNVETGALHGGEGPDAVLSLTAKTAVGRRTRPGRCWPASSPLSMLKVEGMMSVSSMGGRPLVVLLVSGTAAGGSGGVGGAGDQDDA